MTTQLNLLSDRYPQLALLCQMEPEVEIDKPQFDAKLDLDDVELVYLYGIGPHVEQFEEWLNDDITRDLVIIEDQLALVQQFLQSERAGFWIDHPQVHLQVPFNHTIDERQFADECASRFPVQKIVCYSTAAYAGDVFETFSLNVKRATTLTYGRFCETFYYHRLYENLVPNFKRLKEVFFINQLKGLFRGRPAIVCGAGPSLNDSIDDIKRYRDHAVIIAGGSTIAALSNHGINPHLAVAIDPNPDEYPRLLASTALMTPLVFGARLLPDVFNTCSGEMGYLQTIAQDPSEQWLAEKLGISGQRMEEDFGEEALSVTTTSIALASFLGCDPIILAGIDLAYTGMERYAKGVFAHSDVDIDHILSDKRASETVIQQGDQYTLVKWVMESACISKFSQSVSAMFYNASEKGLGFEKIPRKPLSHIIPECNVKPLYIEGALHVAIEKARSKCDAKAIDDAINTLKSSLTQCISHLQKLVDVLDGMRAEQSVENPLITLYEMDLREEEAYALLLMHIIPSIDFVVTRRERGKDPAARWRRLHALYTQLLNMAELLLAKF